MATRKRRTTKRGKRRTRSRSTTNLSAPSHQPDSTPQPNPVGRPSIYSDELVINICARIATGEPLTGICKTEGMPHLVTVYRWLNDEAHESFRKLYAQAKSDAADTLADEMMEIADEEPPVGPKGVDNGAVQHQRLRVDTRKWIAAKLKPKRYGDRVDQYLMGPDGGAIQHSHTDRNALRDQIMASDATATESAVAESSH